MDARLAEDAARIRRSPFFDADWYRATYPDVAAAGMDPALHYLLHGAAERRDPGPSFSTADYAERQPRGGGANPLVELGRLLEGEAGRDDRALLGGSDLFDAAWYRRTYPDVVASGVDPVDHYLAYGAREGRDPGPRFSTAAYLAARPELGPAGVNALVHYLRHGIAENHFSLAALAPAAPVAQGRPRKSGPTAVFVTHELAVGGAPKLLQSLAAWFQRATDYDVRVVAMVGGPLLAEFERFAPVHVVGQATVAEADAPALREAVRAFVGDEPVFTLVNSAAAGDYCRIDPFVAPTFGYVHEMPQVLELHRKQFDALVTRARHIFCGAEAVRAAVAERWPETRDRLSTRPSFITRPDIDILLTPADKAERRREVGWRPDRKLVLGCGYAHWRKQPLAFVRIAAALAARRGDVDFAWIGDGPDLPEMRRMAEALRIAYRLHLPGYRDDLRRLLAAADVFALPSVEDPFPLVGLEAGALSATLVAFREATGLTELIEPTGGEPGGLAVPLDDEDAFVDAVDRLLGDEPLRLAAAAAMRGRVAAGFVADGACVEILVKLREQAGLAPRVSVLLPRIDDAALLREQLERIDGQTFRDIELLLDRTTHAPLAAARPEARIVAGGAGGGFAAWEAGVRAAAGELVWLADAEQVPTATFLERALAASTSSGVRLVIGREIAVDGSGGEPPSRPVVAPAAREIARLLATGDGISSPGATLVRRAAALPAIDVARGFKQLGLRAFHAAAAHGGRIAYAADAVAYLRPRAGGTPPSPDRLQEFADLGALVRALYGADEARDAAFRRRLEQEASRAGHAGPLPEGKAPARLGPRAPGLLYGVGDLGGGGAQIYAMRLLNAWVALPAPAVLFVAGHASDDPGSPAKLSPLVPIVGPEEVAAEGGFAALLRAYGIDVVVTGHWWADEAVGRYLEQEDVRQPWAIVMHGCYESVLRFREQFRGYRETMRRSERRCDHWVWIAPKNRQLFEEGYVAPRRESQIVTGYQAAAPSGLTRAAIGVPEDALLFTLAGRAMPTKGWRVALAALARVRAAATGGRDVRLLLIGDGPVAEELRAAPLPDGVHAVGHTGRVEDLFALTDVALVPSWFEGETLPLVLIESLALGKPAIVSDIGLCPWAIEADDPRPAGFVVPRDRPDGSVGVERLAAAMERFVADPDLAPAMVSAALRAACKFDMQVMVKRYRAMFDELIDERA